ncbi:lachesin-like [Penaeus japonicus]|uniref:lachesin-like n=1 Tax=Penaeus japonicus TaxID=27405 RepID=UPI001C70EFA7|nr:lachesin-like [Penaeus japonicus]
MDCLHKRELRPVRMTVYKAYGYITAVLIIGTRGVAPDYVGEFTSKSFPSQEEILIPSNSQKVDRDITAEYALGTEDGGAIFPENNNTLVVAQVGGEAAFSCYTNHISNEMVTWLKRDDDQLLTVGQVLYAAETRYSAAPSRHTNAWELWVKDVQLSDAGQYECQLTTYPPVTFFFTLKVLQAEAVINGPREVHIEEGSKLALECHVRSAVSPPVYIFWYHNSTMVNYGRQHTLQVNHRNYTSSLVVGKVRLSDAGIYSCEPHLATPANVSVHVVKGNNPAAMQHGHANAAPSHRVTVPWAALAFLVLLFHLQEGKRAVSL